MTAITLKSVFQHFKKPISFTFLLTTLENSLGLLRPLLLGFAIDALLAKELKFLFVYLAIELLLLIVATGRRLYDTRAYAGIYRSLASNLASRQRQKSVGTAVMVARADMLQELIDFYEHDLPATYYSIFGVVGGLIILTLIDVALLFACLAVLAVITIIYAISYQRIFKLNSLVNNELERRVIAIEKEQSTSIKRHFFRICKFRIQLSDNEAINFSIIGLGLMVLVAFALYFSAFVLQMSAGTIFSTLTYIVQFAEAIVILPLVFQQMVRLKEISTRFTV